MRDKTAREPKFPAACARCGGRISEPVTFCPHCGAHARFALAGDASHPAPTRPVDRPQREPHGTAASARAEPTVSHYDFEGDLDPPWPGPPTPLFASPDGDPYGAVHAPGFRGERQWGLKSGTALVVAAFVILYGGAVAVHRYDGAPSVSQPSSSKSAEGAIAPNGSASNAALPSNGNGSTSNALQAPAPVANATPTQGSSGDGARQYDSLSNGVPPNAAPLSGSTSNRAVANTAAADVTPPRQRADDSQPPDMSIASLPPPAATQAAPNVAPAQPQSRAAPNTESGSRASGRSRSHAQSADGRSYGDAAAAANAPGRQPYRQQSPREGAQSGHAAAARALDIAQAQLAKSDLRGARASLGRALAADPNNGDALSLREQLLSREQERDASLSAAHACVVQSRWNCVWHNAGKALSVDASSTEARALVDRAIVESGAATAPAGPGPDTVQVPMVQ